MFRLYKNSPWRPWHTLQQFYIFALTLLFGLKVVLLDLTQLLTASWSGVSTMYYTYATMNLAVHACQWEVDWLRDRVLPIKV